MKSCKTELILLQTIRMATLGKMDLKSTTWIMMTTEWPLDGSITSNSIHLMEPIAWLTATAMAIRIIVNSSGIRTQEIQ